jgi:NADH-quinone oxidoreductase subunit J
MVVAGGTSLVLLALLARFVDGSGTTIEAGGGPERLAAQIAEHGAVGAIGVPMFLDYVVPLQVTGLLLLVAVIGAVVLAKRHI